jgi:hypothetical protein
MSKKEGAPPFGEAELLAFLREEARMEGSHVVEAVKAGLEDFWKGRDDERRNEHNIIPTKGFFIVFLP